MSLMKKVGPFTAHRIAADDGITEASFIAERGGMGASIIMPSQQGSRELLFLHDYFSDPQETRLTGGWPFCFPICGRLERYGELEHYYYNGHNYRLPIHGFAWQVPWQVRLHEPNRIQLVLTDTPETLSNYPFAFEVILDYCISPGLLTCTQTYSNCGDKPMPYYAGFHPYFLTPAYKHGKEQVILDYQPEACFAYNATLSDLVGMRSLYSLPTPITADINERLTSLGPNKTYHLLFPEGDHLQMTANGVEDPDLFRYTQIYTPLEQPFICIEPWMGHPNALNTVTGVRWLQPGQSEHGVLRLQLTVA